MVSRVDFYQAHLNRVSRSFAFCIEKLEAPLRAQVGLSYLICRILDTVEDAPWAESEAQINCFHVFQTFMNERPSSRDVSAWVRTFPVDIPEGEQLLLNEAFEIFSDFHDLSHDLKAVIGEPVLSMCRGMMHFAGRRGTGSLRLRSLAEVNQYCFFVAGVVGEILTRLITEQSGELKLAGENLPAERKILPDAFHFGLFLQKVNLLKDQRSDEEAGRYLVPSRDELFSSLGTNATAAIRYVLALPEKLESYRLFCSWSLFLGLASLPWIERSYHEKSQHKIPREQTLMLFEAIEKIVGRNSQLHEFFHELLEGSGLLTRPGLREQTQEGSGKPSAVELVADFSVLYRGRLNSTELIPLLS